MLMVPLFYRLFVEETFWVRGLYVLIIVLLPFLFGLVGLLVVLHIQYAAVLATTAFFLGAWLVTALGASRTRRRT